MTSGSGGPEVPGYGDLRVLGRGGFATVYRARQLSFDREVALKVLDGAHADDRTRQLFTRECRAAGSLSWHPHVVPVYDAGTTANGTPYLAMELLPGGSLADALGAHGALASGPAVRAAAEVASALAAAHEMDLLHRDVKPANVLVDRLGRAQLADFGIARVVGTGSATATGAVTGTVAYMAPEVLQGGRATPASDIYALGLTLLTLLVGRNPLMLDSDDSPFVVIARVVAGTPLEVPGTVPAEVRAQIEACTERDPSARPDAAKVAAALADLAAGAGTPIAPTGPSAASPGPERPSAPPGATPARGTGIPPPPTSAVRVRPDHTLAEPPPPAPPQPVLAPTAAELGGTQVAPTATPGGTQVATPPGGTPSAPPRVRRRRWVLAVAVAAVVVLAAVGAVLVAGGGDDDPSTGTAATDGASTNVAPVLDPAAGLLDEGDLPGLVRDATATGTFTAPTSADECGASSAPEAAVVFSAVGNGTLPNLANRVHTFGSEEEARAYLADHQACSDRPFAPLDGVGDEAFQALSDTQVVEEIRVGRVITLLISTVFEPGDPQILDDEIRDASVAKISAL